MFRKLFFGWVLTGTFLVVSALYAEETASAKSFVSVTLTDGNVLKGKIIEENETTITLQTPAGLEVKIDKTSVVSIKPIRERVVNKKFHRLDPNYSRLLFGPTGRLLRRGEGYVSSHELFFPGVAYGIIDNLTVMGGISILPGVNMKKQLKYISARVGVKPSEEIAFSGGILGATFRGDTIMGMVFATGSIGPPDKSFTGGIGWVKERESGSCIIYDFSSPIIMLGGNIRLSDSIALVFENWFFTGGDCNLSHQPLGVAVRFFGKRLAVDVGVIIVAEILAEGFPIPWLSFVYNFGK
jgi:hypothetical protein